MHFRLSMTILPIILLIISLLLIFYKFTFIPLHLSFDEVEFAKLALSLEHSQYAVYSPFATGHSTLYFYILLASMKLFGIGSFALRLPSALCGVINVLLIYLIMKNVFKNNVIGLITAFIFVMLRWYFNFARFSFEATFLLFLELTSIYFLLRFLDKDRITSNLILSAIFAGLSFHSYYPGRIFFIVPVIWLLMNAPKKYFLIFTFIAGIIMSPLIWHNVMYPDVRVSQISFLSDSKIPIDYKITGVMTNIGKTLLMTFWHGDMNGRHNFPGKAALNPILGLFLLFGIIMSSSSTRVIVPRSGRFINHTLFFLMYMIISIIPTVLSSPNDNPNMLRTFTMIPSIIYFIGMGIFWIVNYGQKNKKLHIVYPVLTMFLIISTVYELRTYFMFQSRVFNNSFEVTCELKNVVDKEIIPKTCRVQKNMF